MGNNLGGWIFRTKRPDVTYRGFVTKLACSVPALWESFKIKCLYFWEDLTDTFQVCFSSESVSFVEWLTINFKNGYIYIADFMDETIGINLPKPKPPPTCNPNIVIGVTLACTFSAYIIGALIGYFFGQKAEIYSDKTKEVQVIKSPRSQRESPRKNMDKMRPSMIKPPKVYPQINNTSGCFQTMLSGEQSLVA